MMTLKIVILSERCEIKNIYTYTFLIRYLQLGVCFLPALGLAAYLSPSPASVSPGLTCIFLFLHLKWNLVQDADFCENSYGEDHYSRDPNLGRNSFWSAKTDICRQTSGRQTYFVWLQRSDESTLCLLLRLGCTKKRMKSYTTPKKNK